MTRLLEHDRNELERLFDGAFDGVLTPEEWLKLSKLISLSPEVRRLYLKAAELHGALAWQLIPKTPLSPSELYQYTYAELDLLSSDNEISISISQPARQIPAPGFWSGTIQNFSTFIDSGWPAAYTIAAVIVSVALFIASLIYLPEPKRQFAQSGDNGNTKTAATAKGLSAKERSTANADRDMRFVGRITAMIDCEFSDTQTFAMAGSSVPLGRKYSLARGLMEITYNSGAKVILQGPCQYEVNDPAGGYLSLGKLTARIYTNSPAGKQARLADKKNSPAGNKNSTADTEKFVANTGLFTITTPTARITDLGTEFGVEVLDSNVTEVHVFQGAVEFHSNNSSEVLRLGQQESVRATRKVAGPTVIQRNVAPKKAFVRQLRVPIQIFSTGAGLEEGQLDPHWQIVAASNDENFQPRAATVGMLGMGRELWASNIPGQARWIIDPTCTAGRVVYTFQTTFDITDVSPEGVSLVGWFMADNYVKAIRLNGNSISVPPHGEEAFRFYHSFTIEHGFVEGRNVLEIDVMNLGNNTPMGLCVELKAWGNKISTNVKTKKPNHIEQ